MDLQFIYTDLFREYEKYLPGNFEEQIRRLSTKHPAITKDTFGFYTSVSSVFSSKIEGEDIELDSYLKHKFLGVEYLPDYTKRIDDLSEAYSFAASNKLNAENIFKAHQIITRNILVESKRGKTRTVQMFIADKQGNIVYTAAAAIVNTEMEKWFGDLEIICNKVMENTEALFYASMLHLTFVKIHPFDDGNGRTARLIEKWFLSNYFGQNAWHIESERYYYENLKAYYHSLNIIGNDYENLDYSRALPFMQMLVQSLSL